MFINPEGHKKAEKFISHSCLKSFKTKSFELKNAPILSSFVRTEKYVKLGNISYLSRKYILLYDAFNIGDLTAISRFLSINLIVRFRPPVSYDLHKNLFNDISLNLLSLEEKSLPKYRCYFSVV